ncbi:MAG: LamG domain protein jellyroll fold domain protein [Parcubacteria group bacterium GW2011_GWB1_43_8]|nr:MAG: LamG domain protein jellyroll fold domain protein [Parcubacteria group bacterium GW2011_GWB1_43_8]
MSSQIQNLKARTIKTRNFVILFFSLILTLAVFSQLKAGNKPQTTYEVVWANPSDYFYSKTNSDGTSAYLGKKGSNVPTVRYQKDGNFLEFSMDKILRGGLTATAVSSSTSVSLETNSKEPNTPTLFYRNIAEDIDANYKITNLSFKVKEEIVLQSPPPPATENRSSGGREKWEFFSQTNAIPIKQKDGSIYFYSQNNNYLFQIDKPFMYDGKGTISNDVSIEIKPIKTKTAPERTIFGDSNLEQNSGLPPNASKYNGIKNIVKFLWSDSVDNKKVLDLWGIEPQEPWVAIQTLRQARPRTKLFYHKETLNPKPVYETGLYTLTLIADSNWLNDPDRAYPVIIDPTITHDESAEFNGQYNRIANASTTAVQLESSYPEATLDPYTVLLLHFNEANGSTSGIKDYASTTRVITANGNASTTSAVTQLGLGNSAAFDGTGDYLTMPDSEDWNFGSGDFTMEAWIYLNSLPSSQYSIFENETDATGQHRLNIQSDGSIFANIPPNSFISASAEFVAGRWYHVVYVRKGNNINIYKNGVSVANGTTAVAVSNYTGLFSIGREVAAGSSYDFNGKIDGVRIIKGRALSPEEIKAAASRRPDAVYTSPVLDASASVQWDTLNWTEGGVKTGDGETLYNSSGLVAQWNFNETSGTTADNAEGTAALDGTLNGFSYTASQDQATTTTGWTANNKKWGAGALMFDGTNDYVSVGDNAAWDFGAGNFTIDLWVMVSNLGASQLPLINRAKGASGDWYTIYMTNAGNINVYINDVQVIANAKWNPVFGAWYYLVLVREGTGTDQVKVYVNGVLVASGTSSANISDTEALYIATHKNLGSFFSGIIDSTRIYSRALSASEILSNYNAGNIEIQTRTGATSDPNDGTWEAWKPTTGETQLLSMDSDKANWTIGSDNLTKLLLHNDASGTTFTDSSVYGKTVTALAGATQTTTSIFVGNSAVFDGAGDGVCVADSDDWAFGQNFTIDFDFKYNVVNNYSVLYEQFVDSNNFIHLAHHANGHLYFVVYSGGVSVLDYYVANWNPGTTKHHLEVTRSGSNVYIFIDGVSQTLGVNTAVGTGVIPNLSASACFGGIGSSFLGYGSITWDSINGWMDEMRISNVTRHSVGFTAPTLAYLNNGLVINKLDESTIKQENTASMKVELGAPQVDGNTVALWHFEETGTTTGTYLYDETANNNDATTTGTTVVDGIFGKARKFGTVNDYIRVADNSSLDFGNGDFAVDFWVKFNTLSVSNSTFFQPIPWTGNKSWALYMTSSNSITFNFTTDGSSDTEVSRSWTPSIGVWHHITVTRNGSNLYLFADGIQLGATYNIGSNTIYNSASYPKIGAGSDSSNILDGTMDEVRFLKGRALSPDEIAETYRMGANHHLTRQVSAVDLSAQTKLPFWIAADRTGTFLEAMLGESDFANYELASSTLALSTTTVLYIKGDEIASSTSIKDSSFSGKTITANGNARTAGGGKIGNSMYFDGTGDYLSLANSSDWSLGTAGGGNYTIDFWTRWASLGGTVTFAMVENGTQTDGWELRYKNSTNVWQLLAHGAEGAQVSWTPSVNVWYHVALVRSGSVVTIYVNGVSQGTFTDIDMTNNGYALTIGAANNGVNPHNGNIDEYRIIKGTALTPDQIRQAYEYGLRSHPITIDFGATLQPSDLISNSTDYNFSLTATTSGLSATTSGIYLGDKIIIKENLGGTEYSAQGTVNAINTSTGAITVPSWDSGSTFPSGNGYSPNATVFKWQREYFDITGAATTTRDAITNLTLRPTNGAGGRTIYLDDFRYNTNYLTASSSSAITSSNNRYLQYRTIFTSTDTFVSPFLSAINTLYTALANSFPSLIGISGGGFLSF